MISKSNVFKVIVIDFFSYPFNFVNLSVIFICHVFFKAILRNDFNKVYILFKSYLIVMCVEYIKNKYYITKLSEKHDLNGFSCGLDDMDDFLKNDALNQQIDNLNVTYLAMYDEEIIGFFSLLSDSIRLEDIGNEYDLPYSTCPAIKIGRFAINEKYNSLGLGTVLLDNTCYQIKRISEILGVRFITVDAYCNVRGFYYKNEFNHLKIHNERKLRRTAQRNPYLTIPLYKDLKRL